MRRPLVPVLALALLLLGCGHQSLAHTANGRQATAAATPPAAVSACVVMLVGQIHGTVTRAGDQQEPPVYVSLIFSGGPTERRQVRDGSYALPLLARRCSDGMHWVRFGLSAVGFSTGITPTSPDVRQDFEAGEVPAGVPAELPDCVLVLGTLSGRVLVHGAAAPKNTLVTSAGPPGAPSLDQATRTDNEGEYTFPSLGIQCGSEPSPTLIASISALGTTVTLPAEPLNFRQDVVVP